MTERDDRDLTPEERRLQEAIRGLEEVRPGEGVAERLRRAFVSGDFTEVDRKPEDGRGHPSRGRLWTWGLAAAAVLAVALVLWMPRGKTAWEVWSVNGAGTVELAGKPIEASDTEALEGVLREGGRLSLPEAVSMELQLGDVMVVGLAGGSEVTLPRVSDRDPETLEGSVARGEFMVKSGPGFPGRRLVVVTDEGRVEITGTTIAVNKMPDLTCICVLSGTARIGMDEENLEPIPAGMRKVMFSDGRPPMVVAIEPGHEQDLNAFEDRVEGAFR